MVSTRMIAYYYAVAVVAPMMDRVMSLHVDGSLRNDLRCWDLACKYGRGASTRLHCLYLPCMTAWYLKGKGRNV